MLPINTGVMFLFLFYLLWFVLFLSCDSPNYSVSSLLGLKSHTCIFVSSPLGTDPTGYSDSGSITACPITHSNTHSPHCHSEPATTTSSSSPACCPCSSPATSSTPAAGSVHPAPANSQPASATSHSPC